jgi:MFS family permease
VSALGGVEPVVAVGLGLLEGATQSGGGDEPSGEPGAARLSTFASLRYPGAGRYFTGLTLSMCGSWMQTIAQSWLVSKRLGGDGAALGLLSVFQFAPMLFLGAWAGAIADRIDKRRIMIVTQVSLGLSALALGLLDVSGHITMPLVLAFALISGVASSFDTPARRAMVGDLVPKHLIPNAMALNTGVITSSRVFGMTLGGFVIKYAGTGWCFLANGISYGFMLIALTGLRSRAHASAPPKTDGGVMDAVRHVWRTPILRVAMIVTSIVSVLTFNYAVTFTLMVKNIFRQDADVLGWLLAASSVGSFAGSMIAARRREPTLELLLASCLGMGLACFGFGMSSGPVVAAVFSVPLGLFGGLVMTQLSGLLPKHSPSSMRGRVLALQSVVFIGSTPIGSPIVGLVSEHAGARWGMYVGALGGVAGGLTGLALRRPGFRQSSVV